MLSHWENFQHKAPINNKQYAREFLKAKNLREDLAQIRGTTIGFKDGKLLAEFLLKQKNV